MVTSGLANKPLSQANGSALTLRRARNVAKHAEKIYFMLRCQARGDEYFLFFARF